MGKKLQIIWLEPKSDLYVKKKIIDTVARERVLSGSTIEKDAIVKVLFRTKYYNARIVSTDGKWFWYNILDPYYCWVSFSALKHFPKLYALCEFSRIKNNLNNNLI